MIHRKKDELRETNNITFIHCRQLLSPYITNSAFFKYLSDFKLIRTPPENGSAFYPLIFHPGPAIAIVFQLFSITQVESSTNGTYILCSIAFAKKRFSRRCWFLSTSIKHRRLPVWQQKSRASHLLCKCVWCVNF